ncbi:hypothetical protein GQ44DRAFT_724605 [Phaeosphaeriaceae sp. PMI808]|nr:hypothetical protein GQ44DRAFT_724605 [Phaeosphaeriaceae sp. PMI808]
MAHAKQTFRFMSLPKEIRLMVYERLPTKITHRSFDLSSPCDEHGDEIDGKGMDMVCSTISGLSILSVCRAINMEATTILQQRLYKLRTLRLILNVNKCRFKHIAGFLGCSSTGRPPSCHYPESFHRFINHYTSSRRELHVQVAIREFAPQTKLNICAKYDERIMSTLIMNGMLVVLFTVSGLYDSISHAVVTLNGAVMPALNTEDASIFLSITKWLQETVKDLDRPRGDDHVSAHYGEIDETAWDTYWAEGERFPQI